MVSSSEGVPAITTRREEALTGLQGFVSRSLGWAGYISMGIFVATLVAGLAYVWKKGVLDWSD